MAEKRWQLIAVVCGIMLGACAPATQKQSWGAFGPPAKEESTVVVQNNYMHDMVIYLVSNGGRARLGRVSGLGSVTLRIPAGLMFGPDTRIQADPVGPDQGYTSPRLNLFPGSSVELRLENNLAMSRSVVW